MYPEIKFNINPSADIKNAQWITKAIKVAGRFLPSDFPKLNKNLIAKDCDKIIAQYTRHAHKINAGQITRNVEKISQQWEKIAPQYFRFVDKIFHKHPWPKGQYVGYASIYYLFPRDLRHKTFYFPCQSLDSAATLKIIAHEMLHFIFFDYLKKTTISRKKANYPAKTRATSGKFRKLSIRSWKIGHRTKKYLALQPKPSIMPAVKKYFAL